MIEDFLKAYMDLILNKPQCLQIYKDDEAKTINLLVDETDLRIAIGNNAKITKALKIVMNIDKDLYEYKLNIKPRQNTSSKAG